MATAKKTTKAAGPADKGLRIVSRHDQGMRRAGRWFGPEGQTIALADLSEEEVEALKSERGLVVVEVDIPAAA